MAVNPELHPNGLPLGFPNERFVLTRDHVDFEVGQLANVPGGKFSGRGTIYVSTIRLIFVADNPVGNINAFDLPLLYIHDEQFNQPIFFANNLSGKVYTVGPEDANREELSFKITFKQGGVGTLIPMFFYLLKSLRASATPSAAPADAPAIQEPQMDEMIRHAYVDPNDPTKLYLQQPSEETLR